MLEVLDHVAARTARAKGLGERLVGSGSRSNNEAMTAATVIGLQFGLLLGRVRRPVTSAWPGVVLLSHLRDL